LAISAVSPANTGTGVLAPCTGLVCFHIDGNEGLLTRENWEQLDLAKLSITDEVSVVQSGNWVEMGRPLARIVDNLSNTSLGLEVSNQQLTTIPGLESLVVGQSLWIQLPDGEPELAKVLSLQKDSERLRMILGLSGFKENLIHFRKLKVNLIIQRWSGMVLPHDALVFREEVPGVYILYKGWTRWKSIEILGETDAEIVVKGLEEGAIVVTNPRRINDGIRLH
jgi:putative membrane fusion protein